MLSKTARTGKRAALMASAAGLATAASLALAPASPALAAAQCNTFTSGGVTFSICIEKTGSGAVKGTIGNISGTYVSGNVAIFKNGSQVKTGCFGQYYPSNSCPVYYNGGSGSYFAIWHARSGQKWSSPTVSA